MQEVRKFRTQLWGIRPNDGRRISRSVGKGYARLKAQL